MQVFDKWLYLGSMANAANVEALQRANVKAILNVAASCPNLYSGECCSSLNALHRVHSHENSVVIMHLWLRVWHVLERRCGMNRIPECNLFPLLLFSHACSFCRLSHRHDYTCSPMRFCPRFAFDHAAIKRNRWDGCCVPSCFVSPSVCHHLLYTSTVCLCDCLSSFLHSSCYVDLSFVLRRHHTVPQTGHAG